MSAEPCVLFRVDAGGEVGAGHLMRCFALAEGLTERHVTPVVVTRTQQADYVAMIARRNVVCRQIPATLSFEEEPAWIAAEVASPSTAGLVLDRYELPAAYAAECKRLQPHVTLVQIDDWLRPLAGVDVIVNQNLYASAQDYPTGGMEPPRVLAGSRYVLLRSEFRGTPPEASDRRGAVERLLLTLGGDDPPNHTLRLLSVLAEIEGFTALHVVLGPGFRHRTEVEAAAARWPHVRLWFNPANMREIMRQCDLSVNGSGSTLWELYYLGIPNILYILGDDQMAVGERAHAQGCSISLGRIEQMDPAIFRETVIGLMRSPDARSRMSAREHEAVDGRGVERVVDAILSSQALDVAHKQVME